MPTIYEQASTGTFKLLHEATRRWHSPLEEAGVTILVLMASNEDGPALKAHGYPAVALIKPTSYKDRASGLDDVRLILDESHWDDLDDEEKLALLDHELEHLELCLDKQGTVKRDDLDRPKMCTKPHDWEGGFFFCVVERHGHDSPESKSYVPLSNKMEQLLLPFADQPAMKVI